MSLGIFTRKQERITLQHILDKVNAIVDNEFTLKNDHAALATHLRDLRAAQGKDREMWHSVFGTLTTHLATLHKEISQLDYRMDKTLTQEQRRFDTLLQQFVNLAAAKGGPQPTPQQNPMALADLGLFEEVQVGDERGYKTEELELDGMSNDSKPATE